MVGIPSRPQCFTSVALAHRQKLPLCLALLHERKCRAGLEEAEPAQGPGLLQRPKGGGRQAESRRKNLGGEAPSEPRVRESGGLPGLGEDCCRGAAGQQREPDFLFWRRVTPPWQLLEGPPGPGVGERSGHRGGQAPWLLMGRGRGAPASSRPTHPASSSSISSGAPL